MAMITPNRPPRWQHLRRRQAALKMSPGWWAQWLGTGLDERWDVGELAEVLECTCDIVRSQAKRFGVPLQDVDGTRIRVSRA